MKLLVQILAFIIFSQTVFAQEDISLFSPVDESIKEELDLGLIDDYALVNVDDLKWNNVLNDHPSSISLSIPFKDEILVFILNEADLFRPDFRVKTASGLEYDYVSESKSIFYQGVAVGYENSHFAFSVLNNEIIGVGSIPGIGDINLGKLPDHEYYILYAEPAIDGQNSFECATTDFYEESPNLKPSGDRTVVEDCSSIYFEVDYDIFLNKGGVTESADYMMALFNEIQFLFELDDMTIYISEMKVWDEISPYYLEGDTGILLDLFGSTTTIWEGDLGHLVTISAGGGLAWVNVYCNPNQAIRKAVSGISPTFAAVPIYSWSVEVISHEMGHNMGSPHTHACFWNGDGTAIDGCGPDAGFDEGCVGTLPPLGGTVMSYCHLTGVGINLGFGFGLQPGTYMRNNIIAADCLESCDLQVMDIQVTGGSLTATCENSPFFGEMSVINNGNESMTFFTGKVYLDGVLTETFVWTGLILEGEEGTFSLPSFSLPLGSYVMTIELEFPDGYEDEDMSDNSITYPFDVTPFPEADFTPEPDNLLSYQAVTNMNNHTTGAVSYEWDMGDGTTGVIATNPTHTYPFEYGGYYEVELLATSAFGCVDTTYGYVLVAGVNIYYIPNTFTPDGDSFNDVFLPVFAANLDIYDYYMVVYNRWGEVMFESFDVATGWDGNYGGRGVVNDGVYGWKIQFGDLSSDKKHTISGHVTVLR
ncbi:MAG: gliding motility-associated C-terminal domain-containing protein [Crocinitomix sp.]|nr:gliding motility-associated C-terminal domain-containing protein [Crocinitomix sp.]